MPGYVRTFNNLLGFLGSPSTSCLKGLEGGVNGTQSMDKTLECVKMWSNVCPPSTVYYLNMWDLKPSLKEQLGPHWLTLPDNSTP